MTDTDTIEQLNDAVNNTHVSLDTNNTEQHGSNYLKNKKKRDKAKLKKAQPTTDTVSNGHTGTVTNHNNSTNTDNDKNTNNDSESSLLLNDYFKQYGKSLTLTHTTQYNRSTLSSIISM